MDSTYLHHPEKKQTARIITDFRGLNKCLKCNPFPMPKIPDIFEAYGLLLDAVIRGRKEIMCDKLTFGLVPI